ncbi:hypothetical protein CBS147355_8517 [Penicillium roqueforti]|nr:hypothetical protein CBS147355_8517 [Penicillium roqueforti]KAI3248154.1 hypothetical protein CBS147309_8694 [Penicillium roqueforti]
MGVSVAIAPKFSVSRFWTDARDLESTIFIYVRETAHYLLVPPPSPQDRNHKVRCIGPFTSGIFGHHGLIMRGILYNVFVPVAIDPETGDILHDSNTGFALRAPYEQGSDGRWYFLDRLGDTFRWKSENVATAEVSEVLGHFPGITEANVYGVRLPNYEGRAGCAAIQISPDARQTFDNTALPRFVRSKLPKYAIPLFLRIVENPTHIHNHKQNKVPLRDESVGIALLGTKAPEGKDDHFLWIAPGDKSYSPYGQREWEQLSTGSIRL